MRRTNAGVEGSMNSKQLWIALATVAGAAVVAAWLYAPGGEERRKKLADASREAGEYLADAADYMKDRAERLGNEAESAYSSAASALSEVANETAENIGDAVAQYGQTAAAIGNKTKSMV